MPGIDPGTILFFVLMGGGAFIIVMFVANNWDAISAGLAESSSKSNAGNVGIDTQGDLSMGIGGGLGIDLSDGSLTVDVGGFHIDTDGK